MAAPKPKEMEYADEMPDCDICTAKNRGVYDVPTNQGGTWMNLCYTDLRYYGQNIGIGFKRIPPK